jgi:hypothetical protein
LIRFLALVSALAIAACAPQPKAGDYPDWSGKHLSKEQVAQCRADGGKPVSRGEAHGEYCERRYPDAGKRCTDSSQCQGKCMVEEFVEPQAAGKPFAGKCQPVYPYPGCFGEVVNGRAPEGLFCSH